MTKLLLLLQFRPPPTAEHEVICIQRAMKLKREQLEIINVTEGDKFPKISNLKKYGGLVLGASSDYDITSLPKDISQKCFSAKPIVNYFVKRDIPTLAICFGHQLLTLFLGGEVRKDQAQAEGGVVEVFLNGHSSKAAIFKNFPKSFYLASGHKDSITKLPKQAKTLAYTKLTTFSAYQIKNNIFSIQQHPELDVDGLVWRLSLFPEYMKGRSIEEIKKDFKPMPYATKLLLNFKKLLD